MVTVHGSERAKIEARGGVVIDGLLQPLPGQKGCPFKKDGLCGLHFTPDKPFGCIASPFTLNKNGTLIVRNRYKMLPCYRGSAAKKPAYKAFDTSLVFLFGSVGAAKIIEHLDAGGGNIVMPMSFEIYQKLMDNDAVKKKAMVA